MAVFYDRDCLLFDRRLVLVPLSSGIGEGSNTSESGKRAQLLYSRLAAVTRLAASAAPASLRRNRPRSITVVKSIEGHSTHSTQCAVAKGIPDVASSGFTLPLAMMSDDLSCSNSGKSARSNITLSSGLASTPRVFLFVDVNIIVAVVVLISPSMIIFALVGVSLVVTTTSVDFLDPALVVIVFLVARTSDLSVFFSSALNKLIGWFLNALADDDGLRGLLPNNNRLHLHLHGLGGFIADVDGLGWWLGDRLGAEILSRPRVLLQFIGLLFAWEDFPVALVVAGDANLGSGGRRGALILALNSVLGTLRGDFALAFGVVVVSHFSSRLLMTFNDIIFDGAAVFEVVAATVDEAHLGFVRVFLEAVVGHLVAPHRGIASAASTRRRGVPLALALASLVDDRHAAAWVRGKSNSGVSCSVVRSGADGDEDRTEMFVDSGVWCSPTEPVAMSRCVG